MTAPYSSVRARLAARQIVAPGRKWHPPLESADSKLPKHQAVLVHYGSSRVFPRHLSPPRLSDGGGTSKVLTVVKTFGRGPLQLSNLRLGDELLIPGRLETRTKVQISSAVFGNFSYECLEGRAGDDGLSLYPAVIDKDTFDSAVPKSTSTATSGFTTKNTKSSTTQVDVRLRFPNGLSKRTTSNGRSTYTPLTIRVNVYAKVSGASSWSVTRNFTVVGVANGDSFEVSFGSILLGSPATWTVGLQLYSVSISSETPSVRWTSMLSRGPKDMGGADGHAVVAVQGDLTALGNDQYLESLNADAQAELPETVGGAAVSTRACSAAFLDVLQGEGIDDDPLPDARVVSTDLASWRTACAAAGLFFDFTFGADGGRGTTDEALRLIAAAGRARYIVRDGRYTVIREPASGAGSWLYTPANMAAGLRASRESYGDSLHGIRCRIENRANLFRPEGFIVYASGFSESNATKFEDWTFDGTTSKQAAADLAAYHLAVLNTRERTYEFPVGISQIRVMRGDLVRVAHPRVRRGTSWGRVVAAPSTTEVLVSRDCTMVTGGTYGLRTMQSDGAMTAVAVTTNPGDRRLLKTTTPHGASEGDVFAFGTVNQESRLCVVLRVAQGENLTAVLTVAPFNLSPDPGDATGVAVTVSIPEPPPLRLPTLSIVSAAGGITLAERTQ